jgi:minor fimbrial subunit
VHKVATTEVSGFYWNIYANNNVVMPTGGCDVSSRASRSRFQLPGLNGVPVTVHCAKNQALGYYLSGTTADAANSVFTNTASASPAQGIGVQLTRNGSVVSAK